MRFTRAHNSRSALACKCQGGTDSGSGGGEESGAVLTYGDAVEAQALAEEAVELPHVAERGARPAVFCNARLYLIPEGRDELWVLRKVVQCVCDGLRWRDRFKFQGALAWHGA